MQVNRKIAYILGAMRDGSFIQNKQYNIHRIKIYQKNQKWIKRVSNLLSEEFDVNPIIQVDKRDNVWSLMVNSVKVFKKLIGVAEFPGNQLEWNTPSKIMNSSREIKAEYLRGFFDSEGGLPHVEKRYIEPKNIRVHFTQSNKKCLEELKEMINEFGIKTGKVCGPYFKKNYPNPIYRLKIHGIRGVSKFNDTIGSLHPEKQTRLKMTKNMVQDLCEA